MKMKEMIDFCRTYVATMEGPAVDSRGACMYYIEKDGVVQRCLVGALYADVLASRNQLGSGMSAADLVYSHIIPGPEDLDSLARREAFMQDLQRAHDKYDDLDGQPFRDAVLAALDHVEAEWLKRSTDAN